MSVVGARGAIPARCRAPRVLDGPAARGAGGDGGSTLIEVVMSSIVISIVLGGSGSFFVSTLAIANRQAGQQSAAELATDAVESVRALPAATLLTAPPADAAIARSGVSFIRSMTVTRCRVAAASGSIGSCGLNGPVPMLRVTVTVTWPHRGCSAGRCTYTTSTLFSDSTLDPLFAPA